MVQGSVSWVWRGTRQPPPSNCLSCDRNASRGATSRGCNAPASAFECFLASPATQTHQLFSTQHMGIVMIHSWRQCNWSACVLTREHVRFVWTFEYRRRNRYEMGIPRSKPTVFSMRRSMRRICSPVYIPSHVYEKSSTEGGYRSCGENTTRHARSTHVTRWQAHARRTCPRSILLRHRRAEGGVWRLSAWRGSDRWASLPGTTSRDWARNSLALLPANRQAPRASLTSLLVGRTGSSEWKTFSKERVQSALRHRSAALFVCSK